MNKGIEPQNKEDIAEKENSEQQERKRLDYEDLKVEYFTSEKKSKTSIIIPILLIFGPVLLVVFAIILLVLYFHGYLT